MITRVGELVDDSLELAVRFQAMSATIVEFVARLLRVAWVIFTTPPLAIAFVLAAIIGAAYALNERRHRAYSRFE